MSDNDYYKSLLDSANKQLEEELNTMKNTANTKDRINQYAQQDDIMLIYVQKILTILYIIIYLIMGYVLYNNQGISKLYFGSLMFVFFLVPMAFWLLGKYFTESLLWIVRLFISGNTKYLYLQ